MIRFTHYAKPQVRAFSLLLFIGIAIWSALTILFFRTVDPFSATLLSVGFAIIAFPFPIFLLMFFRDPIRKADLETISPNVMLAPADGKITEITRIDDPRVGGPALKIGIFLSVFNVHINRVPCPVRVLESTHKCGEFLNAMDLDSSHRNECNDLVLETLEKSDHLPDRMVVRQIAGLIARRIVCDVQPGDTFGSGQRFGMIKFGSRTELIVPANPAPTIEIKVGQAVRAGQDVLLTYK